MHVWFVLLAFYSYLFDSFKFWHDDVHFPHSQSLLRIFILSMFLSLSSTSLSIFLSKVLWSRYALGMIECGKNVALSIYQLAHIQFSFFLSPFLYLTKKPNYFHSIYVNNQITSTLIGVNQKWWTESTIKKTTATKLLAFRIVGTFL